MNSFERTKIEIRTIIARSTVGDDLLHADHTLEWVMRLDPRSDRALQIAALGHDIERAIEARKVHRPDYRNFDAFKAAHAANSAAILQTILEECGVDRATREEACRLVLYHEKGGDPRSDLLKDADSISFFQVSMPFYYEREGWEETKCRCIWGCHRLSERLRGVAQSLTYRDKTLQRLFREAIRHAASR